MIDVQFNENKNSIYFKHDINLMEEKRETMRREGKKKKKKRETGADTERKYSHRCTSVVIHWISPAIISVIARKHRDMENS